MKNPPQFAYGSVEGKFLNPALSSLGATVDLGGGVAVSEGKEQLIIRYVHMGNNYTCLWYCCHVGIIETL